MTTSAPARLGDRIDAIVAEQAQFLARQATAAPGPNSPLLTTIDTGRDRFVAAAAARTALERRPLHGTGTLLDARTADELSAAISVLETVQVVTGCLLGGDAVAPVADMWSAAVRMVEQQV